ncbi:hypothetical protein [Streptomyces durhamensis]|uniref:hypothetical protein n=1 Tax=Streptomyces durhamensis TaxID=68194 RepID=UPI0004CC99DD|nr:hypothetical protein [Streptomyces durhamensis]
MISGADPRETTLRTLQTLVHQELNGIDDLEARRSDELRQRMHLAHAVIEHSPSDSPTHDAATGARQASEEQLEEVGRLADARRQALVRALYDLEVLLTSNERGS